MTASTITSLVCFLVGWWPVYTFWVFPMAYVYGRGFFNFASMIVPRWWTVQQATLGAGERDGGAAPAPDAAEAASGGGGRTTSPSGSPRD